MSYLTPCFAKIMSNKREITENLNLIAMWGYYSNQIQDFLNGFSKSFFMFTFIVELLFGRWEGLNLVNFTTNTPLYC